MDDIKEYDKEELKREIAGVESPKEKSPQQILSEIKAERKRLEEERQKLQNEKDQEKEEEPQGVEPKPEVKSFAKERRKRKELERLKGYLLGGEYALIVVFVLAQLFAEGISSSPLRIPLENSIYLIIIFFLVIKIEKFYFRYMNMEYSGTLQRKAIGVDLFRALEWPIIIGWVFVVAIFAIPPTAGFISTLIEIFSFKNADGESVIPFTDGFMLNLALLFLAHLITGLVWVLYLSWYKENVLTPELKAIEEPFEVQEVFLITSSGLLITRVSEQQDSNIDDDIISSMLTAVSEFVKDSFGSQSEEGELDELQYGRLRIILEYGKDFYLAAVVRGQESTELRPLMKKIIKLVHRKFTGVLDTWDGDLAQFKGAENMLNPLLRLG
jgi:hypothetical protein